MHRQVVSEIVEADLCIGCGVCVGVCPSSLLSMRWEAYGDLTASISGDCPPSCNICLKVCPFADGNFNEDQLAEERLNTEEMAEKHVSLGYALETYVGHVVNPEIRGESASGGLATVMLQTLMECGEIDSVFCVGRGTKKDRQFEFVEINDPATLGECASSRYYPVDIGELIRRLQQKGSARKVAVTGLPCTLKGVALSTQRLPRVRRQIRYMVGLVCGHLPNRSYTEYLVDMSLEGARANVSEVNYRSKRNTVAAHDFKFIASSADGKMGKELPFSGRAGTAYVNDLFQYNACNYCDDVFAEVADVSVMDAWLPPYSDDPRGHSLLVVRNAVVDRCLRSLETDGRIVLETIANSDVERSQRGVLFKKRDRLAKRLNWAHHRGLKVPKKRVAASDSLSPLDSLEISSRRLLQSQSKAEWARFPSSTVFHSSWRMRTLLGFVRMFQLRDRARNLAREPRRLLRKIRFLYRRSRAL